MESISELLEVYEKELYEQVLPFWANHCISDQGNGFNVHLDSQGEVYTHERHCWMQWRIVYMFSFLYHSGRQDKISHLKDKLLEEAEKAFAWLYQHGKEPGEEGRYYFALGQDGRAIRAAYSVFSEAFVVMACCELYAATQKPVYLTEAKRAMHVYCSRKDNAKGEFSKDLADSPKRLNLGYYMIMANLGTVLAKIGVPEFVAVASDSIDVVMKKFWSDEHQVFFENVNTDGTFDVASSAGRHLIPGHSLEALWFIIEHCENDEKKKHWINIACDRIEAMLKFGWDEKYGGIFYFMDVLGKPHIELTAEMKLWWVHNEALIACLYAFKHSGKQLFMDWFKRIHEYTFSTFRDHERGGGWYGYAARDGRRTSELKGGPWKTFFHVPRCLYTCAKLLSGLKQHDV